MTTLVIQPGPVDGIDTLLEEYYPNTNYKTSISFSIRAYSGAHARGLIKFDLTALAGANIQSATLYLYGSASGSNGWLKMRRILAANSGWTADATWNYADGSSIRWAGDTGGNGGADAGCMVESTDYSAGALGGISNFDTTPLGQENSCAFDLTEFGLMVANNYGFVIYAGATGAVAKQPIASNYTLTPAYRPKLVVEYTGGGNVYVRGVECAARPAVAGNVYMHTVHTVVKPAVAGVVRLHNTEEV